MKTEYTHEQFWRAIDEVARRSAMSYKELAEASGIAASTVAPCNRYIKGKPRWISVGNLFKILSATNMKMDDFVQIMEERKNSSLH